MSSAVKRIAQQVPQLARGFRSSAPAKKDLSHFDIVHGDGFHGVRPGYTYDWENGPHYLQPWKVPNFHQKFQVGIIALFATAISIPCFAVWYQQNKLKA